MPKNQFLWTLNDFIISTGITQHAISFLVPFELPTLRVPAKSRILTGDSQKLSFSILRKVLFLIFWSDKPPRRANSAHVACSQAGTWAMWAEGLGVSYGDKIYIFKILMRNCLTYQSSSQIRWIFFWEWAHLTYLRFQLRLQHIKWSFLYLIFCVNLKMQFLRLFSFLK